MTIALALMLATMQVAASAPQEPAPAIPADWSIMPPVPWRSEPTVTRDLAQFVEAEVRAGRCVPPRPMVEVELAVFVRADGFVRAVVPRAIDCPSVEQFAAGLVTSFARNNLRQPAGGWYRTSLTFAWSR